MNSAESVTYANWWSRLLCNDAFDRQFFIPVPPPRAVSGTLEAAERLCFPRSKVAHLKVERPVFIVGMPRTGTTMLYNLLCTHEHAAYVTNSMNVYPNALNTIEWLRKTLHLDIKGERYLKDSVYTDFGGPSEMMTMWGKWTGRQVSDLDWESQPLAVTEAMTVQAHEDLQRVLYAFGPQARRVFAKNPVLQPEMLAMQTMFPDARFIHIIRDGRQVANSLSKLSRLNNQQLLKIQHPELKTIVSYPKTRYLKQYIEAFGLESLECTARVWRDTMDLVKRTAPSLNHFVEVRYEDLLASPREEMEKLFAFCDLPWPSDSNSAFQDAFSKVGRIHHTNQYGDYEVVERIAGDTLREYGYSVPVPVS